MVAWDGANQARQRLKRDPSQDGTKLGAPPASVKQPSNGVFPMDAAAWIALAGAISTAGINLGGYFIAWGAMKATVAALTGRVAVLEGELRALDDLKLDVARLETRLDALIEQV